MNTTVIGAYPKISDEHQDLRRALHAFDRKELDQAGLDKVYDESTRTVIGEIEAAGVEVVNDGQLRWDDLLARFARAWGGASRGPLERFYDNNTYYRIPVIEGALSTDGRTLARDFAFARSVATRELKAAVCGPLTFATLADDRHYKTIEDRVLGIAEALAAELRGLQTAGATLVDVEDPALVATPQHIEVAREAYRRLAAVGVPLAVHAYFFPADRILESLASFPVAQVGIDVRSRESNALTRLDAFKQTVVLGVVDARNTRLETASEVAHVVERALRLVPVERLWVAPTTGLEYLPHDVAVKKLGALVEGARAAAGAGAPVRAAP